MTVMKRLSRFRDRTHVLVSHLNLVPRGKPAFPRRFSHEVNTNPVYPGLYAAFAGDLFSLRGQRRGVHLLACDVHYFPRSL